MGQSVYPSSPSSSPRNAASQIFATYQPTGTYTYSGSLAPGKYAVVADTITDGIGLTSAKTYAFTGQGLSGTVSNNGTAVYFYTSTPTTFSITGGITSSSVYQGSYSISQAASFSGPTAVSLTPRYYHNSNALSYQSSNQMSGGSGYFQVALSNGQLYTVLNSTNTSSTTLTIQESASTSWQNTFTQFGNATVFSPSWTQSILGPGSAWTSAHQFMAYGNGTLVALAYNQPLLYVSADGGASWISRTLPQTPAAGIFSTIAYVNSLWMYGVQTGTNFYIYTSTDTVTWTQRYTLANAAIQPHQAIYGTRYVMALGNGVAANSQQLITSTDLVTWNLITLANIVSVRSVAYGGGKYVATGTTSANSNFAYTSTDGVTWGPVNPSGATGNGYSVAHNGTVFCITTHAANYCVSTDAVTWTNRAGPTSTNVTSNITVMGTNFYVTSANATSAIFTSTDAVTWTSPLVGYNYLPQWNTNYTQIKLLVPASPYLYAFVPTGSGSSSSPNEQSFPPFVNHIGIKAYMSGSTSGSVVGVTPIKAILPGFGNQIGFLDAYTTVGSWPITASFFTNATLSITTNNSSTWNTMIGSYTATSSIFVYDATFSSGFSVLFCAGNVIYQGWINPSGSTGSLSTNNVTVGAGTFYSAVYVSNTGVFLAGGAAGLLYSTTSGNAGNTTVNTPTWTVRTSTFGSNAIRGIAYGAGVYVIVGDAGSLATSTDSITWTSRTSGFGTTNIRAITGRPSLSGTSYLFAIAGDNGLISTSTDGITWTVRSSGITNSLSTALPFSPTIQLYPLVFGGAGGVIVYASSYDGSTWKVLNPSSKPFIYDSDGQVGTYFNTNTQPYNYASPTGAPSTNQLRVDNPWLNINTVAYGNNLYIAAGIHGYLYSSTDAITWVVRSTGTTETITASAYLNSTYVFGTLDGNIYTSTDTVTWTLRTSNITPGFQVNFLGYLNGQYFAGYSSTVSASSGGALNIGTDLQRTQSTQYYSGYTGFISSLFNTGGFQVSTDLITWTTGYGSSTTQFGSVNGMCWNGSNFLTANGGAMNALKSNSNYYSGTNFAAAPLNSFTSSFVKIAAPYSLANSTNGAVVDVAYNNGYICVILNNTNQTGQNVAGGLNIWYSTDLITWSTSSITNPTGSSLTSAIRYYDDVNQASYTVASTLRSVTPGPNGIFIITSNSPYTDNVYVLEPVSGSLSTISLPASSGQISPYKHNVAYNPTTGKLLFANRSGNLASGTISVTTTNTYYPSIFSLYSVNA